MKETLLLIGAAAIAFFAGRGIVKDIASISEAQRTELLLKQAELESEIAEVEMLKMKAAYLEGVRSCQNGEDWQDRWAEIESEFAAK